MPESIKSIYAQDESSLAGEARVFKTQAFKAYEKAAKLKNENLRKRYEPLIATDAKASYFYASCLLMHRFQEGEPAILTSPNYASSYANHVIHGRWEEAEPKILEHVSSALSYCEYVIQGRWPELEEKLLGSGSTPHWNVRPANQAYECMSYAVHIMKERWKAAEPIIGTDRGYVSKRYAMDIFHIDEKAAEEGIDDPRFETMGYDIFSPPEIEDIDQYYNVDETFKAFDKIGQLLESI